MSEARKEYLGRLFRNGKTLVVPIDHGTFIPVPGLERTGDLLESLRPFADGFIVNLGVARHHRERMGERAVLLRCDLYRTHLNDGGAQNMYYGYGAAEAAAVGAHGLVAMCFPGNPNEKEIHANCTRLISQSLGSGLPVILESVPFGLGFPEHYTPEKVAFACRLAAEMGADVVKTAYPGDRDAFARIVEETPVPVVVLGGACAPGPEGVIEMVADSIAAGGAGIAIGRNVWQAEDPARMAQALHGVIHEGLGAAEAVEVYRGGG